MYFYFSFYTFLFSENYTEKTKQINWAAFENHWDLLLHECAKTREKETYTTHKTSMKTHIVHQTKDQLRHNISSNFFFLENKYLDGTSQ